MIFLKKYNLLLTLMGHKTAYHIVLPSSTLSSQQQPCEVRLRDCGGPTVSQCTSMTAGQALVQRYNHDTMPVHVSLN